MYFKITSLRKKASGKQTKKANLYFEKYLPAAKIIRGHDNQAIYSAAL